MPLLRKAQFARLKPPEDIRPNDDIFFCKLTGEVFNDYEKFFQRIILCNSLVWTCAFTGRPNMTFSEALHSEKRAQEQLNNFPTYLQGPLLYLARLTHRSRLNDVVDDVYVFSKDRYFIGESVFAVISDERKPCKIVEVFPPDGSPVQLNGTADDSTCDSDVICLDDEPQPPQAKKIKLSESMSKEDEGKSTALGPSPLLYRYTVQEPLMTSSCTVEAKNVSRKKGLLTRDKCKLFLKQHCLVEEDGIWRVKAKYAKRFSLASLSFSSFFAGPLPTFEICEAKKRRPSARTFSDSETPAAKTNIIDLTEEDETMSAARKGKEGKEKKGKEKEGKEKEGKEKAKNSSRPTKAEKAKKKETEAANIEDEFRRMRREIEERARKREEERLEKLKEKELRKEELKRKADELRQKRKEVNEKKKLEKKEQDALLRELNKPREDLECEDLKDLPTATPVSCGIPNEAFGDAVLVLEYLLCFRQFFEFNLPKNISVDALAKALNDTDVDGLFADLVRELLSAIFGLQDEEQNEGNDERDIKALLDGLEEYEDKSSQDLVRAATVASQWPVLNYGTPLRQLQLDGYTLTEVVRLHLLSSGSLNGANSKYDYQQRGGYSVHDDPGLVFRQDEASVLRVLGEGNIFDLTCAEKLKILSVLIHQLLTYVISRDVIDDNCEKLKQIQKQLRLHQWAEHRRDKDETHFRWRKRTEGRMQDSESNRMDTDDISGLKEKSSGKKQPDSSKQFLDALKTKDYENMPTENLDWDRIGPAERAQAKEWFARRERELMDLAVELQRSHSICPIGRDRVFRRFWLFQSIPGLFVEDQEDLIPSEYFQPVAQTLAGKTARVSGGNEDGSSEGGKSDKENFPVDGTIDGAARLNGASEQLLEKTGSRFASVYEQIASRGRVRWAFYGSPEEVDCLIESLNPRGLREGVLRAALVEQKESVRDCVSRCNPQLLCRGGSDAGGAAQEKRGGRSRSKQQPNVVKYGSAQECLENNLREMLLDIEERIDVGSLGSLKVNSRDEWRRALEEGRHNSQSGSLMVAGKPIGADGYPVDERHVDVVLGNWGGSREVASPLVRDLASALLQIEQMIDHRYFEAPLGNEAMKKAKQKAVLDAAFRDGGRSSRDRRDLDIKKESASVDSDEEGSSTGSAQHRTALERWEESLMSSTSLPQIFLHLAVLESSIMWSKSALHARCRICRRKGDGERMLLCDSCDRGHHMYCLKPPVKHIPSGDWFCPTCRPKDLIHSPRKQRKSFDANVSEDDDSESVSAVSQSRVYSVDDSDEEKSAEDEEDEGDEEEEEEENTEEEDEEEEEEKEEDSDAEIVLRPTSAKIKFVKGTRSRKSDPSPQAETSSAGRARTRLRGAAAASNASSLDSSLETTPVSFQTRQKTEPATNRSKFSFYQTGSPPLGARRSAGVAESPSEGCSKRTRASVEEKGTSRRSLPERNVTDESSDKNSFVTKSRAKDKAAVMKTCEDLVTELSLRDDAWPFLKPVTRREAPDYLDIIKTPMDFSAIRNKVNRFEYLQPSDLLLDVHLIFANCKEYNLPTAEVFTAGQKLESHFQKRLRELKLTSLLPSTSGAKSAKGDVLPRELRKRTL